MALYYIVRTATCLILHGFALCDIWLRDFEFRQRTSSYIVPAERRFVTSATLTPGYSSHNIVFTVFGHDSLEGGLYCEFARLACAIVAGNRWDGYFSTSATELPTEDSELLLGSDYYFIVSYSGNGNGSGYEFNDSLDTTSQQANIAFG